jgi:N-acetylglucosamine malate deacetylase 1
MIRSHLRRAYRIVLPLLFARRQYKLLLRATIQDIGRRQAAIASVIDAYSSYVQPIPIRAPFGASALVVAPHQDDEVIGCGGAVALQVKAGRPVHVVVLQDGADEYEAEGLTREALAAKRNAESGRAAAIIGLGEPEFFGYPCLSDAAGEATERLRHIIRARHVDAVFVPFVLDSHPDHRAAAYIVADALETIPWIVRVFGYEVWGCCVPNVLVVIDEVMGDKLQMLECFVLANQSIDYVHATEGLNMSHSRMLGAGEARYVERFCETPRAEYIELVKRIRAAEASKM